MVSTSVLRSIGFTHAVILTAMWVTACGDGATGPTPTPNRAPLPSGAISAQTVTVGQTTTVDVEGTFTDPDGDALTYTASNSDAGTASISMTGSVVTVVAVAQGVATITVTARDPGGLSAQLAFSVTVPNQVPIATSAVPEQSVFVEETASVDMAPYFTDPDGDALTYTATSSDAAIAVVSIDGSVATVVAVAQGVATITVTARDPGGLSAQLAFSVTVPNQVPIATSAVPEQSVFVEETASVDMAPYFTDPDGDALTYTATSSDAATAVVSIDGSVATVVAVAQGVATITVTARDPGGLSARTSFPVTVPNQAPVAVGTVSEQSVLIGEMVQVDVVLYFTDPDGDVLTYTASSSNVAVATTSVSGSVVSVEGIAQGMSVVTVTASDPSGVSAHMSFRMTVQMKTQARVVISRVVPSVLIEGREARITGSGFSATAVENHVSIGGRSARVTAATRTSLTIEVPRADCRPPRRDELRVTVGGDSDVRRVGVTPRTSEDLELELGWYRYTYGGNGCVHLPGDPFGRQQYLIGVVSSSEDSASLTGVTLTGTPGDATVVGTEGRSYLVAERANTALAEAVDEGLAVAMFSEGPFRPNAAYVRRLSHSEVPADDTLVSQWTKAHNEIMDRNQALLRELGGAIQRPPTMADARRARRDPQMGNVLTLYVSSDWTCTNFKQVRAVVRWVGNSSIWLDDLDNPTETFTNSELADLDAFYSANIKGVHDEYFGGLSDVDGNRRFMVLMTKEANRANLGGWVWSGDLYSSTRCRASNEAEIFYGKIPDDTLWTKQALLDYYPSLIAHEVAHLVQFGSIVYGSAVWKTAWEIEGGATIAEQLVGHRLFRHGSDQELGWSAIYPYRGNGKWYWYWNWINDMSGFFGSNYPTGRISGAPEECSWISRSWVGPCRMGNSAYGVPSMVLRYAMDRWGGDYPGGERALMKRLTQSPENGFASLVDVSPERSWRPERILSDFYITLWGDIQGWKMYGMTTWDLHDIFTNLPENQRLRTYTSSSSRPRLTGRRVRAGSSLYFHWTPSGRLNPTSISVTSTDGGRLPDHISIWAYRVR